MPPLMTGPDFGLRELANACECQALYQFLTLFDWYMQPGQAAREWIVGNRVAARIDAVQLRKELMRPKP